MTPLRQRMVDAMVTRGFAARTQEGYVEAIANGAPLPSQCDNSSPCHHLQPQR